MKENEKLLDEMTSEHNTNPVERFKTHHISSYVCHICSDSNHTFKNSTKFPFSKTSYAFYYHFPRKILEVHEKIMFNVPKKIVKTFEIFFQDQSIDILMKKHEKSFSPPILFL